MDVNRHSRITFEGGPQIAIQIPAVELQTEASGVSGNPETNVMTNRAPEEEVSAMTRSDSSEAGDSEIEDALSYFSEDEHYAELSDQENDGDDLDGHNQQVVFHRLTVPGLISRIMQAALGPDPSLDTLEEAQKKYDEEWTHLNRRAEFFWKLLELSETHIYNDLIVSQFRHFLIIPDPWIDGCPFSTAESTAREKSITYEEICTRLRPAVQ